MRTFWKLLFVAAGLTLFGWYLHNIGPEAVWAAIISLGVWAPFVLVPYLVVYVVDCLAWVQTLPNAGRHISFWTLLRIRWCGESLNNLIPSGHVGGEAVKVLLLRGYGISAADGATAAVVSKSAQTLAQLLFIILASLLFAFSDRADAALRAALLLLCTVGFLAVGGLFWVQTLGVFRMLISLADRLRIKSRRLEARRARLLEIDNMIIGFYRRDPRQFYRSTLFYFAGWALDAIEIYLVAHLLGIPVSWSQAIVVEAFTGIAKILGMWVPGSLGIQESGIILSGRIVGLPDTLCGAYAVIRRFRELIFAGIGMVLLYRSPVSLKGATPTPVAR